MSPNANKLLTNALELSDEDRATLAARLIDSLDRQVDEEAPGAWDREIARRVAEMDQGTVDAVPWPEARRRIRGGSDGAPQG